MLSADLRIRIIENLSGGAITCGLMGMGHASGLDVATMLLVVPVLCILGIILLIASGLLGIYRKERTAREQADMSARDFEQLIHGMKKHE